MNNVTSIERSEDKLRREVQELEDKINDYEERVSIFDLIANAPSGPEISVACDNIKRLLLEKNISYGDSFSSPINIFSKATATEQLAIRIDDKLNRLAKGSGYGDEDTILDLIGYLILYKISQEK